MSPAKSAQSEKSAKFHISLVDKEQTMPDGLPAFDLGGGSWDDVEVYLRCLPGLPAPPRTGKKSRSSRPPLKFPQCSPQWKCRTLPFLSPKSTLPKSRPPRWRNYRKVSKRSART